MDKKLEQKSRHLLQSAGLNTTRWQILVLQQLLKARSPLSREDLLNKLAPLKPDKVTIYRILEKLHSAGLVHRAYIQQRAWYYELAVNCQEKQCHPHFTCTNCGKIFCLTKSFLPMITNLENGFVVHRQQTRLEGLCPRCSQ